MTFGPRASACVMLAGLAITVGPRINAQDPQQIPASRRLLQADAMFADGRYAQAQQAYRDALVTDDREIRTRAAAGLVFSLLRVGDFVRVYEAAQKLRDAHPEDPAIAALYGEALWAFGLFEKAEAAFEAALERDPHDARARHGMARSLAARSRLIEAVMEALEAIRLTPREPDFHYTIGQIFERLGRFDEAADRYAKYADLLPGHDSDQRASALLRVRYLQSFGNRRPIDMGPGAEARIWTIPITIRDDKVYVTGRVNRGTYQLMLDTGSEQTVVSRDLARREGIVPLSHVRAAGVGESGVRGQQVGRIEALEIGDLSIRNVPCLIKNPPLGGAAGREPDGFSPLALGLSMRIDYGRRQLVLARDLPAGRHTHRLQLRLHRLAVVGGTLNGTVPAAFAVDTGGEVISISHSMAGLIEPRTPFRRIPLRVYGTSGRDRNAFLMPNVDLHLETLRFSGIPVVVLDLRAPSALLGFQLGGTLGHRFLSKYTVSIDLARSVVELRS